jgi:hypothetical protein
VVAVVSVAMLGEHGLNALRGALELEQGRTANLVWTLAGLVGDGPLATALEVGCAAVALAAAWRNRRSLELATVAGVVGSLLAFPYRNPSDYALIAPAAWLYVRAGIPIWHWAWLAFGLVATYLAAGYGPYLLVVFTVGWLVLLATRSRQAQEADHVRPTAIEPAPVSP